MKSQVGFIAIGQGGGNIGLLFEKAGYNVLYLNTSAEDLATLEGARNVHHIKGGEGCNKDRNKAKELVEDDFDVIAEKITQALPEEYVFVIFTAGGGTGSGSSPMLIDLLIQYAEKKVGAVCVLPSRSEQLRTFANAYECFVELEGIEGMGATFVLDNNTADADKFTINSAFFDLFDSLLRVPQHRSAKGNIDIAEVKELLSTRGAAIISKLPKGADGTKALIKSFKDNIFAPLEDDRVIKYIGLSAVSSIDLNAVTIETGTCLEVFQGSNPSNTVCILCGLTYPYTELGKIKEKVEENKETLAKIMTSTRQARLERGPGLIDDMQGKRMPNAEKDISDVFAKYRKGR